MDQMDRDCTKERAVLKPAVGEVSFGKLYKCGPKLGSGGFGTVYSGFRVVDGLPVAIKCVPRDKVGSWEKIDGRFVPLEICLLWNVQHVTGVICMLDWFERAQDFLIVMERPSPCSDLFDFISKEGNLEEHLARNFFKQVVQIVIACAAVGVLHRDIKDENLIVDLKTCRLKVIDFGSGAFLKNGYYTDFEGTRVYSPPEFILHNRYDGRSATVWSLGILLYDMIFGDIPFHRDDDIIRASPSWGKPVSTGCRDLISRCLAVDEGGRPSFEDLLNHPWVTGSMNPADVFKAPSTSGPPRTVLQYCASEPNRLGGGVNPNSLRRALLENGARISGDETSVDLSKPPTLVCQSSEDTDQMFSRASVPSNSSSVSSAANGASKISGSSKRPLITKLMQPLSILGHRATFQNSQHQSSYSQQKSDQPASLTSLGSVCSSGYGSACSSYIGDGGLCSSL